MLEVLDAVQQCVPSQDTLPDGTTPSESFERKLATEAATVAAAARQQLAAQNAERLHNLTAFLEAAPTEFATALESQQLQQAASYIEQLQALLGDIGATSGTHFCRGTALTPARACFGLCAIRSRSTPHHVFVMCEALAVALLGKLGLE